MTDITLTHEPPAEGATETPATGYPESTLCLRLEVEGIGLSWTLRGSDESMSTRLPRVLDYLKRLQARLPRPSPTPQAATVPPPQLEEHEDWCPIHQAAMRRQSNDRGSWYSHRVPGEGYCKGRRRKAGA